MSSILRVGILGAAGIAPRSMIAPAARRPDVEVVAIASRSQEKAEQYATRHDIPLAYGDYRQLLADTSIDLVYVALPPSEHAEWSIAALERGKDVLCEKPFSMDEAEAIAVIEVARREGRRVIEAFHDHYHPLWQRTREIVATLGDLVHVAGAFCVNNPYSPGAIRHEPHLGGGALMDLGCYPLHWMRSLLGEEPSVRSANHVANPVGADASLRAELAFASGVTGTLEASMTNEGFEDYRHARGERGTLTVHNVVFPSRGHSIEWTLDGIEHRETAGGMETYDHQLERVVNAIRTGEALPTEGPDIVANMRAIGAIYRAVGLR